MGDERAEGRRPFGLADLSRGRPSLTTNTGTGPKTEVSTDELMQLPA